MSLTFEELKEHIKQLDELTIVELLNLTSFDLVEAFDYKLVDKFDKYAQMFEEARELERDDDSSQPPNDGC